MSEKFTHREPISTDFKDAGSDPVEIRAERRDTAAARRALAQIRMPEIDQHFVGHRKRSVDGFDV